MSRIGPFILVALIMSACASQAPARKAGLTPSEFIADCLPKARRDYEFVAVSERFKELVEMPFSDAYKEKLLQAYGRQLKRLEAREALPWGQKSTSEETAKAREQFEIILQKIRAGEPVTPLDTAKHLESYDPESLLLATWMEKEIRDMAKTLCLEHLVKQMSSSPLPRTEVIHAMCWLEVKEAMRKQHSKVFQRTATDLQKRFLAEAADLSPEEREEFVDPYCNARVIEFIEEFAKRMGPVLERSIPPARQSPR